MKYPIESIQFAARLIPDDLVLLNEAVPQILPDIDLKDDKAVTGRAILMGAVETAVSKIAKNKTSLPEDTQKIKVLEGIIEDLEKALQKQAILTSEVERLTGETEAKDQVIEDLGEEISNLTGSVDSLQKYKPVDNEMRIVVEPFTLKALIHYARRVSKKTAKEIQPGKVLTSLFNYYITKREVEFDGFPFVLTPSDLRNIKESLKKPVNEPTR